jgi:hypothetical protein
MQRCLGGLSDDEARSRFARDDDWLWVQRVVSALMGLAGERLGSNAVRANFRKWRLSVMLL